jgi:polysaccharide deacetylase family protein (PEP-CTERM system associated)
MAADRSVLNAFSVDVEDYFQVASFENTVSRRDWDLLESRVESNTRRLLELLASFSVKGTFFTLGWVAERAPDLVGEIHDAGHEVAIHGYDHRSITSLSPDEFRADIRRAKRLVEDAAGAEVTGYRAPNYSLVHETLWAADILLEEGFRYDSSVFPIVHDRYGIHDAPRFPWPICRRDGATLIEFPISTVRLMGLNLPFVGGGYLRHFPMPFVRWGMRRINHVEGEPTVVYVHPWEIDPEQPRLPAPRLTRLRHYRNLEKTERRLGELCREFQFGSLRQVLEAYVDERLHFRAGVHQDEEQLEQIVDDHQVPSERLSDR